MDSYWRQALGVLRGFGGVPVGAKLGERWKKGRYSSVYMRNALWDSGYAVDTMETAIPWHATTATVRALEAAGKQALEGFGERCHAYTHVSHVYGSGSSAYSTFLFRVGPDQQSTYARWAALKKAVG